MIRTFMPDATRSWIVAGTLRGTMTVWDVRFGVQDMSWAVPFRVCANHRTGAAACANRIAPIFLCHQPA
jgi:hypothetical protein